MEKMARRLERVGWAHAREEKVWRAEFAVWWYSVNAICSMVVEKKNIESKTFSKETPSWCDAPASYFGIFSLSWSIFFFRSMSASCHTAKVLLSVWKDSTKVKVCQESGCKNQAASGNLVTLLSVPDTASNTDKNFKHRKHHWDTPEIAKKCLLASIDGEVKYFELLHSWENSKAWSKNLSLIFWVPYNMYTPLS